MQQYTCQQVGEWLRTTINSSEEKIETLVTRFLENEVDGQVLLTMTNDDLRRELNIEEFGLRRKILLGIEQWKQETDGEKFNEAGKRARSMEAEADLAEMERSPKRMRDILDSSDDGSTSNIAQSTSTTTSVLADEDHMLALSFQPRQCQICLETFEIDFLQPLQQCTNHLSNICRSCMNDYIVSRITNRELPITCPIPYCTAVVTMEDLELIVEKKYVDLFEEYSLTAVIDNDRNFSYCLTPDCGYVFAYNKEVDSPDFQCPKCTKRYCLNCKVDYHVGTTCQQYEQWVIENGTSDDLFADYARTHKLQRCPQCERYVQRRSGCPHMTCLCGAQFCYICGNAYPCNNTHEEDHEDEDEDEDDDQ